MKAILFCNSFFSDISFLYTFFIFLSVFLIFTIIRLIVQSRKLLSSKIRLKNHLSSISANSRMEEVHSGDFNYAIKALTRSLLTSLSLDDVGYWEFDELSQSLKVHESGRGFNSKLKRKHESVSRKDFPNHIEWFQSGTIFYSDRPKESHILQEVIEYLYDDFPYQSSLGCPVILDGKLAGVITAESRSKRKWKEEDIMLIQSIADNISQAYRSKERFEMMLEMQKQQQYIQEMNLQLEQDILIGEQEVVSVNKKLAEYAYINAHKIRGPICRLLGLKDLLEKSQSPDEILKIGMHLAGSIEELNQMTHQSSEILKESTYYKSFSEGFKD